MSGNGTGDDPVGVLVVDDEAGVRRLLVRYLNSEGFRVFEAGNGEEMRAVMARHDIGLVLLDVKMPGEDGFSLARGLRAASDVPIIMITGRGDTIDRVLGLEMGADDYIPKPFHMREVLARINSVLRRAQRGGAGVPTGAMDGEADSVGDEGEQTLDFAGWRLDVNRRLLLAPDAREVPLTTGEYDLLKTFLENPTRVLSRDQLMDMTKNREWTPFDRSIDTQIGRLRKKLEHDPRHPELIKTVHGAGYVFTQKVERRRL